MWLLLWWQGQGHPTNDSCPDGPGPQHPQQQSRVLTHFNKIWCFHPLLLTQSDLWYSCRSEDAPHPVMIMTLSIIQGFISSHFLQSVVSSLSPCRDLLPGQRAIAMISEMIHTASLVHDDVIDGSDKRRGKRTINEMWGERKVREIKSSVSPHLTFSAVPLIFLRIWISFVFSPPGYLGRRFHPLSCLHGLGSYW